MSSRAVRAHSYATPHDATVVTLATHDRAQFAAKVIQCPRSLFELFVVSCRRLYIVADLLARLQDLQAHVDELHNSSRYAYG